MLTKLTSKNQITLPKKVMSHFANTKYFNICEESGKIILVPVKVTNGDAVRDKLTLLGINHNDIQTAIQWVRK